MQFWRAYRFPSWRLRLTVLTGTWAPRCCNFILLPQRRWMSASPAHSMSAVVKAVLCGGVDMKLRRVLLSGCMSCTRMNLPPCGNFSSKRLLSLVRPFSPGMERTRTATLEDAVPCGDVTVGLHRKSCSVVTPTALCSPTAPVSRCQPRRCYSALMGNGNLLEGGAPQAGENGHTNHTAR